MKARHNSANTKSRQTGPHAEQLATYIEIDFAENTTRKAMAIRKSKELSALLGKPEDVQLGGSMKWYPVDK